MLGQALQQPVVADLGGLESLYVVFRGASVHSLQPLLAHIVTNDCLEMSTLIAIQMTKKLA